MEWFLKAAQRNNARSQLLLGGHYYLALGVPQNYAEAIRWFMRAEKDSDFAPWCARIWGSPTILASA